MSNYILITFESTNYAMQAENQLKKSNAGFQVIPTPREITLSCGLSIKISKNYLEVVKEMIESGKIKIKELYEVKNLEGQKIYNQWGR